MRLLEGWYPGLGEVEAIRRMSPAVQEFVADASRECPDFIPDYLLGILDEYECPNDKILHDLSLAIYHLNCQDLGLAGYGDDLGLGNLGFSLKSIKKSISKVAKKVIAPIKKVIEKITPKPILNIEKKVAKAITSVNKAVTKVQEKVEHVAGKIGDKYGNVIIQAAGAVLAPFTGGASLAAAAALTAAHTAYQKKRAADAAKAAGKKEAAAMTADADAANAETMRQVDAFYAQNQQWFITNLGVTPDQWARLTLQQKIDMINRGATGQPSTGATGGSSAGSSAGGGFTPPAGGSMPSSGGGSGTPGGGGGGGGDSGMEYPSSGAQGQQVATSSMFSGPILPMLAAGVALALVFGKPVPGRKTKRNPGRRRRRVA
jgi:hypothetical protein